MKILIAAPDSTIPNLAIMKISAWHKARGDLVDWAMPDPDLIYISIMQSKNKWWPESIKVMHPGVQVLAGGPGYDPAVHLPPEIEIMPPDHSIYPSHKYSVGRVTSGCPRHCHFCVVPNIEPGGIRFVQHPAAIWEPGTILRLIDDNILALPAAFDLVHDFVVDHSVPLHMEYFDIRFITPTIAKKIIEMNPRNGIWIAFDFTALEKVVRDGVKIIREAGFHSRELHALLYCHDESCIDDVKYRWNVCREIGIEPFLMVNNQLKLSLRMRRIRRVAVRPGLWRGLSTEEIFK